LSEKLRYKIKSNPIVNKKTPVLSLGSNKPTHRYSNFIKINYLPTTKPLTTSSTKTTTKQYHQEQYLNQAVSFTNQKYQQYLKRTKKYIHNQLNLESIHK
jgi:hypothetical protein